jgi:tRNA A37 methylthiotransferase MiaB
MRSFHFVDKACYRRREDLSLVRRFFLANGWTEAATVEGADCVLLFTCAEMRYKVANMTRDVDALARRVGPGRELIVGGCLPKTDPEALARVFGGRTVTPTDLTALNELPGVATRIEDLPPLFGVHASCEPAPNGHLGAVGGEWRYLTARWVFSRLRRHAPTARLRDFADRRARARDLAIYVAAGCAKNCSYCAIHFATGAIRSKPLDSVVQAIAEGLHLGYRTFNLHADSIGGYGRDLGTNLGELFDRVLALPGRFTIGIDDLHPHEFLEHFDRIVSLCRAGRLSYLYLPLQSGNERVLRLMNRGCDVPDLRRKMLAVRRFPAVFLQTCIIVGFPGETEAEFEDSLELVRAVGFDDVFVHYYCDMPNTPSSRLPGKTDKATMVRRLAKVEGSGIRYCAAASRQEWDANLALP